MQSLFILNYYPVGQEGPAIKFKTTEPTKAWEYLKDCLGLQTTGKAEVDAIRSLTITAGAKYHDASGPAFVEMDHHRLCSN